MMMMNMMGGGMPKNMMKMMMDGGKNDKKAKTPGAQGGETGGSDPKNKLINAVQLIIDRSCTKGDIAYEVQEMAVSPGESKTYQATVTIVPYDGANKFAGEVADSGKKAEQNAAAEALKALKDLLPPLEEARAAKNRAREEEHEAKKAAKKAEAEN